MRDNWLTKLFTSRKQTTALAAESERGIGGAVARKTASPYFAGYFAPVIARAGVVTSYAELTEEILNTLPDRVVRDIIKDASPIVAKALADYADSMASGFTYTADKLEAMLEDSPAQTLLDDFFNKMETDYDGVESLIEEVSRGMFSHGAAFMELIIQEDGVTPEVIKSLDPNTAVFVRAYDDLIGEYYELGQDVGIGDTQRRVGRAAAARIVQRQFGGVNVANFVSLQGNPTVKYRPVQKDPNNPYGKPILDPAVFHVIMLAGFLSKFADAIEGHVYPHLLLTIDKEKFRQFSGTKADPKKLQEKLNATIEDLQESVKKLKPGGAIIQGDEVSIGGSLTGTGRLPLGQPKDIQDLIRRDLIVAVQSQPILMGSNESVTETHARHQMLDYARLIRRGQKALNAVFTGYLNLILRLNGYPPLAEFKLAYENAAMYRDQAETFNAFRQGLLTASQDRLELVASLDAAKASGYIDETEAQAIWDSEQELRRQVDILPQDL